MMEILNPNTYVDINTQNLPTALHNKAVKLLREPHEGLLTEDIKQQTLKLALKNFDTDYAKENSIMDLQRYLDRINYQGELKVDSQTLRQIHHHHLRAIPYENISVQLGEAGSLDAEASFEKIVIAGRGGWCYEMNGLLQWALTEIGFSVSRLSGGVLRSQRGDRALGNHLVLAVEIADETWIADVGFGDGVREAFVLREGPIEQQGMHYNLNKIEQNYWRFSNHEHGGAADFDFQYKPADEALLQRQCDWLQTAPESPFMMALVCQKFTNDTIEVLVGRVKKSISAQGVSKTLLMSSEELHEQLRGTFGLEVEIGHLWERISTAHDALFGSDVIKPG
jgi:N-hydroxyarylamine O-acetyltransferase